METNNLPQQKKINEIVTRVQNDCWKEFSKTSTISKVSKTDLKLYNENPNTLQSYSNPLSLVADVKQTIERVYIIYFGVRVGQVDDVLTTSIVSTIILKFKSLTTQDLINAFERIEIKKDGWKHITKSDIIDPIANWWNVKTKITSDFQIFKDQQNEAEESKRLKRLFIDESIGIYKASLKAGEWKGDVFNASVIAKGLVNNFTKEQKQSLYDDAERQKKYLDSVDLENEKESIKIGSIGVTVKRLYAELIVKESIKNNIEL